MKQKHSTTRFTDEELILAHKEFISLGKIAAHFKVPHITIHRRCAKLGLTFSAGNYKGCGKKFDLQDILLGKHPQYPTGKLKQRLIVERILDYECSICNIHDWNGKYIELQLDHIDGDCTNHKLENLRLICPNCHSLTPTYCGRNK